MKINTISTADDWNMWTEAIKKLSLAQINTGVGEKIVFENKNFPIGVFI